MEALLFAGLLGGFGGIIRASIGLSKAIASKKKIKMEYWFLTAGIGLLVGIFAGILMDYDYKVSLLAGYAGTDLIEGIYKSFNFGRGYINTRV